MADFVFIMGSGPVKSPRDRRRVRSQAMKSFRRSQNRDWQAIDRENDHGDVSICSDTSTKPCQRQRTKASANTAWRQHRQQLASYQKATLCRTERNTSLRCPSTIIGDVVEEVDAEHAAGTDRQQQPSSRVREALEVATIQRLSGPASFHSPPAYRAYLTQEYIATSFPHSSKEITPFIPRLHRWRSYDSPAMTAVLDGQLFQLAWACKDVRFSLAARVGYVRTIKWLRGELGIPNNAFRTLQAALVLLHLEMYAAVSQSPYSWTQHTRGVLALMCSSGAEILKSPIGPTTFRIGRLCCVSCPSICIRVSWNER